MICGQCGTVAEPSAIRCARCDSDLSGGHDAVTSLSSGARTSRQPTSGTPSTSDLTRGPGSSSILQPGHKFGSRYTIIRALGAGGMGAVYQAWDESLEVAVALKLIRSDVATDPLSARELEARFKRELLLARQVTHPNVVRIHDLGELGETKYLTMAYVQGADLAAVLRRDGPMPAARALAVMRQITSGLAAAHDAGVIHRDLKPANVMIENDGRALLTDFGLARSLEAATLHTLPGSVLGTLDYMAPEQARGSPADRRTDVYALGLIFYDLLAGGRPRAAKEGGLADLLARIDKGPPPIRTIVPSVPPDIEQIVERCIKADPQARYASAGELLADLDRLGPEGVRAPGATLPRRTRWPQLAAVAALVVLVAGATWWLAGRRVSSPPATVAREPVTVLIADFDNQAGDPVFQGSLEQALAIAIEGASFITSYPRAQASDRARELRAGSGLDASGAQLVALREGVGVVLAGTIAQQGTGYRLQVRALRPGESEPFTTANATASDKSSVLKAVGDVAADVRKALGDTKMDAALQAETFSTGSLEAVRAYTIAQTLSTNRKNEEAIQHYRQAIQHDPNFGRAYAGWAASAFDLGHRNEAEQLWNKALSLMDRMTEREKFRTLGAYYLGVARNYDKAIENYKQLVEQYPADLAGHNNLALAYFFTRNFDKAREYGRQAIETYPASLKFRNNYALYAMYAGDFAAATENAQHVLKTDPRYDAAYLPLAMAAAAKGDMGAAAAAYEQAKGAGRAGVSLATLGLADLAQYAGRFSEAVRLLEAGVATDRAAKNSYGLATKSIALAEAYQHAGNAAAAVRAAEEAMAAERAEFVLVPAGRVLASGGQTGKVSQLIAELEATGRPEARAYARIVAGELAHARGRYAEAASQLVASIKIIDMWLARLDLGMAYVQAGRFAEAISELEACIKRRGEATSVFLDDVPTYRYYAVVPYWRGRAQEGLKMSDAAIASFEQYLQIRSAAQDDPLATDARRRIDSLRQAPAAR